MTKLFNNFYLSKKVSRVIIICSLSFLLPIIILLYYFISMAYTDIHKIDSEIMETNIQKNFWRLDQLLNSHRELSVAILSNRPVSQNDIDKIGPSIEESISQLKEYLDKVALVSNFEKDTSKGNSGQITTISLLNDWKNLNSSWKNYTNQKLLDEYAIIIQKVNNLKKQFGISTPNNSNLIAAQPNPFDNLLKSLIEKKSTLETRVYLAFTFIFISLLIAVGFVLFTAFGISRLLKDVNNLANEVASGNIQKAKLIITGTDEGDSKSIQNSISDLKSDNEIILLHNSISNTILILDSLLSQVRESGVKVNSSSTQITASIRQLETTVAEQASSTHEVNATSKEISSTVNEFVQTMEKVTNMSSEANQIATGGIEGLNDIKITMKILLDSTNEITKKLDVINQRTSNINQVMTTITKVANQTNLLSLNAAIEAEKAGQYGAGFSVVAREIRRLADQTSVAATDIEELIKEMQLAVKDGIMSVSEYTSQTRMSSEKINNIISLFGTLIENTQNLFPQFDSVNQGMQMQSQSAAQISESMEQLDFAAKHTRDSLIEFKEITKQLNDAVHGLQKQVSGFH